MSSWKDEEIRNGSLCKVIMVGRWKGILFEEAVH